ncbi:AAA family ATPase [Bacillus thuringiensis]|uniref:AAA family ATPase n=1 Tax=Bacillus cereus group TaxID=86661 RepID=UPI001F17039C|nr:AAA family ATPase [Bacillus cereus]
MRVAWVRVQDFRSIQDTGRMYVDSNLTVLAGKNESGKSNILKALEAFSNTDFSEEDFPEGKSQKDSTPLVEVSLKLNFGDIKKYLNKNNSDYRRISNERVFNYTVKKSLVTNEQYTYGSIQNIFFTQRNIEIIKEVAEILMGNSKAFSTKNNTESLKEELYYDLHNFIADFPIKENSIDSLIDIVSNIKRMFEIRDVVSAKKNGKAQMEAHYRFGAIHGLASSEMAVIRELLDNYNDIMKRYEQFERNLIIPNFKMLESFDQPVPDSIEIIANEENMWSLYVSQALGMGKSGNVFGVSNRDLKRKTEKFSNEITSLFQNVYTQNQIKLELDIGANNTLNFYIYDGENDIDFLPSQRSKGFQWFLSFFFAINAAKEGGNVILIDEPGPYLHPKAQKDVLKVLEVLTESNQIIFTTHSPYLINPNNLERVRLVRRNNENYTIVENQIHTSSVADQEVYTPIITAVGLDLSGAFGTFGEYNTIVEGISDYYYLECMKKYVDNIERLGEMRFIPSIGVSKIDKLASLLMGWGADFKVLLDNDKAGRDEKKELEQKLMISSEQLIFVSEESGYAIEDLFSREDFLKYIMPDFEESEQDKGIKNSSLFNGKSKALFAKMFKEKLHKETDIKFTSQTIDNFNNLFLKLYGLNDIKSKVIESVQ